MALVHLVRHGHAAAGWGDHADPGLDEAGRAQAAAVTADLVARTDPCPIRTSPLARARETAAPLEVAWGTAAIVDPAFGEIPSPTDDLEGRARWLSSALRSRWGQLGPEVERWRAALLAAVRALEVDTVVFTHFVAINAVVGEATADPAATVFLPANASVTTIEVTHPSGSLRVVALGSEATPEVG